MQGSEKISDCKWLASLVVAAYSEERYDLGEALARLCGKAHRMELAAAPALPVDPAIYQTVPKPDPEPQHEPRHVQALVQAIERDPQERPVEWCEDCNMMIRWSIRTQEWVHINAGGQWVTSPVPAHVGRPPAAVNESNAPAEETPTAVTPSGRCTYPGPGGTECHGVVYWTAAAAGLPAGWVHMDPSINGHEPVSNRPDPTR